MWRRMVWSTCTDVSEKPVGPIIKNIFQTTRRHMTKDRNLKSYAYILASRVV